MSPAATRQNAAYRRPTAERRAIVNHLKGRPLAEIAAYCDLVLRRHIAGHPNIDITENSAAA